MNIDNYGLVTLSEDELFHNLYSGSITDVSEIYTNTEISNQFNESRNLNKDSFEEIKSYIQPDIDIADFDKLNQKNWFMPENYCPDLIEQIYNKCQTDEERSRVDQELQLYIKHNMLDLLFYLKYLVDTMKTHNVLWGIGRGSSVASYVLFLIGIHKIDSIKYNLDINEFFK